MSFGSKIDGKDCLFGIFSRSSHYSKAATDYSSDKSYLWNIKVIVEDMENSIKYY